jgi:hypothetical protein
MGSLLSTSDLIARMTPTALAEMIASIEQAGNVDAVERRTVEALRAELVANVGEQEAEELVSAAS